MQNYFSCIHCRKLTLKNPRIKGRQLYCGSKPCQQARKNKWEKDKLKTDKTYQSKRSTQKAKWRFQQPIDQYQKQYRQTHPEYVITNRDQQKIRNTTRMNPSTKSAGQKIVKTDALLSERLLSEGLYVLYPYTTDTTKKIVKTDTLIVSLQSYRGIQEREPWKTLKL